MRIQINLNNQNKLNNLNNQEEHFVQFAFKKCMNEQNKFNLSYLSNEIFYDFTNKFEIDGTDSDGSGDYGFLNDSPFGKKGIRGDNKKGGKTQSPIKPKIVKKK